MAHNSIPGTFVPFPPISMLVSYFSKLGKDWDFSSMSMDFVVSQELFTPLLLVKASCSIPLGCLAYLSLRASVSPRFPSFLDGSGILHNPRSRFVLSASEGFSGGLGQVPGFELTLKGQGRRSHIS